MTYSSGAKAPLDSAQDSAEPDPTQLRFITRMRWMMVISGATTVVAVAAIIGVIGYRLLHYEGSAASAPAEVTALIPKGAKVVRTSVAGDRIAVVLDVGGGVEVRTYNIRTLRPAGTLRFATEP